MIEHTKRQLSNLLDAWLNQRTEQEGYPGFVVAIRQDKDLIYEQSFQDTSISSQMHKTDMFNVGSQAKLLTATLLLQAVERGELSLEASAVQFIPWLARHTDPKIRLITIEELLWHGAGLLRDGLNADHWQLIRPFPDNSDLQKLVLDSPLTLRSGYKLKYSNLGYALLGEILKVVTGMEYGELIKTYVAKPLGLKSLTVHLNARTRKRLAPGYTERINGGHRSLPTDIKTNSYESVAGCYASASDMTTLISEILTGTKLLSPEMQRKLIAGSRAHWIPKGQRGSPYGLGVMSLSVLDQTIIGHSGTLLAHRSATYTNPATKMTIAVMATSKQVPVNQILMGLFEALDYFAMMDISEPTPNDRFTATLQCLTGTRYILGSRDKVVGVLLDDWYPFDQVEEMDVVNETTLKITHAHDFHAEGEFVHYNFTDQKIVSVRYVGLSMWPKEIFTKWLSENTSTSTAV